MVAVIIVVLFIYLFIHSFIYFIHIFTYLVIYTLVLQRSHRSVAAAEAEKKPEEKKSPSPEKGSAPEFVEKFPDTVSFRARVCLCIPAPRSRS